jgi:hypothetical protein
MHLKLIYYFAWFDYFLPTGYFSWKISVSQFICFHSMFVAKSNHGLVVKNNNQHRIHYIHIWSYFIGLELVITTGKIRYGDSNFVLNRSFEIEAGRWKGVSRENRICKQYQLKMIKDVTHWLVRCDCWAEFTAFLV